MADFSTADSSYYAKSVNSLQSRLAPVRFKAGYNLRWGKFAELFEKLLIIPDMGEKYLAK
ncbi:MAG: hypothetical protein K6A35_08905 [bacterium]|nr:hypothetical protein [bacterium]